MAKPTAPKDGRTQAQKFKDLARELDAPLDEAGFDQIIGGAGGITPPSKEEAFQAKREGKAD